METRMIAAEIPCHRAQGLNNGPTATLYVPVYYGYQFLKEWIRHPIIKTSNYAFK